MAKFSIVPYDTGPLGPSADVDRPNTAAQPQAAGPTALSPLTLLMQAAGALNDYLPAPSAAPRAPVPAPAPAPDPFTPPGPMGMAAPVPPGPAASPVPPPSLPGALPTGPSPADPAPVTPPVNNDLFGRFLRGLLDANPITSGLPEETKDRGAAIFRLFADRAWRDNTLAGMVVSNFERGPDLRDFRNLTPEQQAEMSMFAGPLPTEAEIQKVERDVAPKRAAYEANEALKRQQIRDLGPLSTGEQIGALVSSLFGSALSPELAVGPEGAAYASAGTGGKIARNALINTGVISATNPLTQAEAVKRGDKKEYSPLEHALATAGAAGLGALIPAVGALMKRFGALREAPRVDTENRITPSNTEKRIEQPVVQPPEKVGQPADKPDLRYDEKGIPIIRITPEDKPKPAEGAQALVRDALKRVDERVGAPAEAPPKPATEPAIPEAPRAVEPAPKPIEPAPAVAPEAPPKADVPAVADDLYQRVVADIRGRESVAGSYVQRKFGVGRAEADRIVARLESEGVIKPLDQYGRRAVIQAEPSEPPAPRIEPASAPEASPKSLDTPATPRESAPMEAPRPAEPAPAQPTRAAEQPPDIPDFLRRPLPEKKTPEPVPEPAKPVEPVRAPEAPKVEEAPPEYGNYGPYTNPHGTGYYQGWKSGKTVTDSEALKHYPEFTKDQLSLYQRGRESGVKREKYSPPEAPRPEPAPKPAEAAPATAEPAPAQPVRAAEQPPDIPDFLRRPLPEKKTPEPAAPAEPAQKPDVKQLRAQIDESVARRIDEADVRAWADAKPEERPAIQARIAEKMGVEREKIDKIFEWHEANTGRALEAIKGALDSYEAERASIKPVRSAPKPAEAAPVKQSAKSASTRGLRNKPIVEQAEHYRKTNIRMYTNRGPTDERGLREYFTPGRIVPSYGGKDRVLGFEWNGDGRWSARVEAVDPKTGERLGGESPRSHSTPPTWKQVDKAARDPLNAAKKAEPIAAPERASPEAAPASAETAHPYTGEYADGLKEFNASFGLTHATAKAAGPELVGAAVGGMVDYWQEHGRFGLSARGAIAGALAVAALRHRLPFLSKPFVGADSLAKDALKATGDAYGKLAAKGPAWLNFHPTMGVERELWDKLVRVKTETRNFQDDALKIATYIRGNTTADERILISDWIERRDLAEHGINSWQQASEKVQQMADALTQHVDGIGKALVDVGMLDRQAYDALKGEYLHRYYLPKLAADDVFKQKAARMKASASYALRRGETVEGVDPIAGVKAGDTVWQWTHAKDGRVEYRAPSATMRDAEWFPKKEWKVDRVDPKTGKMDLHRDYTPQERQRMGEIRDANFRFAMGAMEASRDLALGTMFKDLASNPKWSSATDPGGWKKVPTDAVGPSSSIKKYGLLAGRWVSPETWDALKIVRKPWSPDELDGMAGVMNGYLKALGMWKVGKTAYNPATHFNNVMGNVSLAALTGEVGPVHLMKAIGAMKRGDPIIEEAKRAGLSLGREANLGDTFDGVRVDVGLASGLDPRSGWTKFMDWYTNNAIVRAYQNEDAVFKLGAYMRRRAAGETPEEAVANVHKVFFDYSDVPLGVQAVRDFYSPFFTYTYKYAQVMLREAAERPHRFLAAYGLLSAIDMLSYDWIYGDRARAVSDYEREMSPKWLQGRSGFGAQKAIRLPWNTRDPQTGENRALFLNTRYMIPGGDILDWVANGDYGPSVYPQALGNTILGGNPLINMAQSLFTGKDTFFGKPIYPYPDTNLWDFGKRPASEIAANWGAAIRFMATQALPPTLMTAPDKLGQAAVGEGVIPKGSEAAEFFGWTGTDFAGRQRSLARAVGSILGIKIEDVAPDEAKRFREAELAKEVRENMRNARALHRNQTATETRRENAKESAMDRIERFRTETRKMRDLQEKAGAR